MNKESKEKKCPFFDVCSAYIIREMRGENWSQRFCFADFENCFHFQIRKEGVSK